MDWYNLISILFGGAGLVGFFVSLITIREAKRLKAAEASHAEIQNFQSTVDGLKSQIQFLNEQMDKIQYELREARNDYFKLSQENNNISIKYSKKKLCISKAYECNQKDCPVLAEQTKQENEYLKHKENGKG
jgi:predicted RNase H-like nuclease (RuvC/YqgF family)